MLTCPCPECTLARAWLERVSPGFCEVVARGNELPGRLRYDFVLVGQAAYWAGLYPDQTRTLDPSLA